MQKYCIEFDIINTKGSSCTVKYAKILFFQKEKEKKVSKMQECHFHMHDLLAVKYKYLLNSESNF